MHDPAQTPVPDPSTSMGSPDDSRGEQPLRIGRYQVVRVLGQGGFGVVYLGYDEQLGRSIAIKVPHRELIRRPEDAKAYVTEARIVAGLDHPNIVPVYDVGSTEKWPCFVVSKYIEGTTLAQRIKAGRLPIRTAAELVATVAQTLHYAHGQALVHRDVKPGNILLDTAGKPYVADFGLALREENLGHGPRYAGTPAYMSPEQARGEGHRVDGRSDICSLGVVFYELLAGRRPFRADSKSELLTQITDQDPRPLRQIDDAIPRELERICLKALAKRAVERYLTAQDMADDILHFLAHALAGQPTDPATNPLRAVPPAPFVQSAAAPMPSTPTGPISDSQPIHVVPKGLRSFDAHDADFFLELLPGPRGRDGLPESIRFWKMRIEETDPDNTFPIGLIYGPSGCGKSSLIKAGLLPRLGAGAMVVYVEATAQETETRLLNGLRKSCPGMSMSVGLKETLAALRRGLGLPTGKKVLLVLDQFEQWLHARHDRQNNELVQALRHCDGARVQCIVMVRDDFWLAISRFMRELEVELVPGHNIALVDLFDLDHARRVLTAFGRAFGKLLGNADRTNKADKEFLKLAVAGLAQQNTVICVRLALFAEMMKGRPWTAATLREVGGIAGIGVAFLEDTFLSPTANPKHRLHQKAARAVLKALLPEGGGDIKGNMRSEAELRAASGYADRPKDFDELMRILDGEIRLITPTDPEGVDGIDAAVPSFRVAEKYFQLTHDYLVHSLQDWLTRKQKETRAGRAELQLAERAAFWQGKPQNRHLPSPLEWVRIRLFTRSRDWTPPQRTMMRKTGRYYLTRCVVALTLLGIVVWAAWEFAERNNAQILRERLLSADIAEVPTILKDMEPHARSVEPLLRATFDRETDAKKKLLLSLALVRSDPGQVPFLYQRLLQAAPQDFAVIRQVLAPRKEDIDDDLWQELAAPENDSDRRFRAACALIEFARGDPRWPQCAAIVVNGLVRESPLAMVHWKDALQPVKSGLMLALAAALEESKWSPAERRAIIEFYRVCTVADPDGLRPLETRLSMDRPAASRSTQAQRRANVAAALTALGKGDAVWPLLVHSPDPTLRSYLIERLGQSGVDLRMLKNRLDVEKDTSARRALILAMGNYASDRLSELGPHLLALYENDPDAGIHGAAGWVLHTWKKQDKLVAIDKKLAAGNIEDGRRWFVNQHLQTFTIIAAPQGLVDAAPGKWRGPAHRFAIGATEVTLEQFQAFQPKHRFDAKVATTPDSPMNMVTWYDAAGYCNWLSSKEGIPENQWCYRQNKDGLLDFVPDYLKRTGYRLPTEFEWEHACRAGAETADCFGAADEELVGRYAGWFGNARSGGRNKLFPVASLKPNDWGLFDMHGNISEWCQESAMLPQGKFADDILSAARGGSFSAHFDSVGSERRFTPLRKQFLNNLGFRVVRTSL